MAPTGKLHLYTGEGKGKTTAALGLALRASGAGLAVYIGQFLKGRDFSELTALKLLEGITLEQYGDPGWVYRDKVTPAQQESARQGLARARQMLEKSSFQVLILDEIIMALWFGLLTRAEIEHFLALAPENTEIILTGRRAPDWLIDRADLVTEMVEVKHYFHAGFPARRGIEY